MKNIVLLTIIFLLLITANALAADSTRVFGFEYDDTELSATIIKPLPSSRETIIFDVMGVNIYQIRVDDLKAMGISDKDKKYEASDSVIVYRLDFGDHSAFAKKHAETDYTYTYVYVIGRLKE